MAGRPESRRAIESLHLLPIPEPEDIAPFAVFLASDESRSVTGGIFPVDSGYMAFKAKVDTMGAMQSGRADAEGAGAHAYAWPGMRQSTRTGADRTLDLLEAQVGRPLAEVETPVAVVDLDRLEANLGTSSRTRTRTGSRSGRTRRRTSRPRSACSSSSSAPAA